MLEARWENMGMLTGRRSGRASWRTSSPSSEVSFDASFLLLLFPFVRAHRCLLPQIFYLSQPQDSTTPEPSFSSQLLLLLQKKMPPLHPTIPSRKLPPPKVELPTSLLLLLPQPSTLPPPSLSLPSFDIELFSPPSSPSQPVSSTRPPNSLTSINPPSPGSSRGKRTPSERSSKLGRHQHLVSSSQSTFVSLVRSESSRKASGREFSRS